MRANKAEVAAAKSRQHRSVARVGRAAEEGRRRPLGSVLGWVAGIALGVLGTVGSEHAKEFLDRLIPGTNDLYCHAIEAPFLEKPWKGEMPAVLVSVFDGQGGATAATELANAIRSRTGLPTFTTCISQPMTADASGSADSKFRAHVAALDLAAKMGATMVIVGEMREGDVADIAIANAHDLSQDFPGLARLATASSATDVNATGLDAFIDGVFLDQLESWALKLALSVTPGVPSKLEKGDGRDSVAALAALTGEAPFQWQAYHNRETAFWSYSAQASASVARWFADCGLSQEAYLRSRELAGGQNSEQPNPLVVVATLEVFLNCSQLPQGYRYGRLNEALAEIEPYAARLATASPAGAEDIVKNGNPWNPSGSSFDGNFWSPDLLLAKALVQANAEKAAGPLPSEFVDGAKNLLTALIRIHRRDGTPTAAELSANSACREAFDFSLEEVNAWTYLVSLGVDPSQTITDIPLGPSNPCRSG